MSFRPPPNKNAGRRPRPPLGFRRPPARRYPVPPTGGGDSTPPTPTPIVPERAPKWWELKPKAGEISTLDMARATSGQARPGGTVNYLPRRQTNVGSDLYFPNAGESWESVAERLYGSSSFSVELQNANPGRQLLQVGQPIVLPDRVEDPRLPTDDQEDFWNTDAFADTVNAAEEVRQILPAWRHAEQVWPEHGEAVYLGFDENNDPYPTTSQTGMPLYWDATAQTWSIEDTGIAYTMGMLENDFIKPLTREEQIELTMLGEQRFRPEAQQHRATNTQAWQDSVTENLGKDEAHIPSIHGIPNVLSLTTNWFESAADLVRVVSEEGFRGLANIGSREAEEGRGINQTQLMFHQTSALGKLFSVGIMDAWADVRGFIASAFGKKLKPFAVNPANLTQYTTEEENVLVAQGRQDEIKWMDPGDYWTLEVDRAAQAVITVARMQNQMRESGRFEILPEDFESEEAYERYLGGLFSFYPEEIQNAAAHDLAARQRADETRLEALEQKKELETQAFAALNAGEGDKALKAMMEAKRLELRSAHWYSPYFMWSRYDEPFREEAFLNAVAAAELEHGGPLEPRAVRYIRDLYEHAGVNLAMGLGFDAFNFLGASGRVMKGLTNGVMDISKAMGRGIQATGVLDAKAFRPARLVVDYLFAEAHSSVGTAYRRNANNLMTQLAQGIEQSLTGPVGTTRGLDQMTELLVAAAKGDADALAELPATITPRWLQTTRGLMDVYDPALDVPWMKKLAPDNWGRLVEQGYDTVFMREYDRAFREISVRMSSGTPTWKIASEAQAAAEAIASKPRLIAQEFGHNFETAYRRVHATRLGPETLDDNPIWQLAKTMGINVNQEMDAAKGVFKFFYGFRNTMFEWWLGLRPGWTAINYIDSTVRFLISGGNLMDDLGTLHSVHAQRLLGRNLLREEFKTAFSRGLRVVEGDFDYVEPVVDRILRGHKFKYGIFSILGDARRTIQAERKGLRPASETGKLGRVLRWIWGQAGMTKDILARGAVNVNAIVEFGLRTRLAAKKFDDVFWTMDKLSLEKVIDQLTLSGAAPETVNAFQKAWLAGADNVEKAKEFMSILGGRGRRSERLFSQMLPDDWEEMLRRNGVDRRLRALVFRPIIEDLEELLNISPRTAKGINIDTAVQDINDYMDEAIQKIEQELVARTNDPVGRVLVNDGSPLPTAPPVVQLSDEAPPPQVVRGPMYAQPDDILSRAQLDEGSKISKSLPKGTRITIVDAEGNTQLWEKAGPRNSRHWIQIRTNGQKLKGLPLRVEADSLEASELVMRGERSIPQLSPKKLARSAAIQKKWSAYKTRITEAAASVNMQIAWHSRTQMRKKFGRETWGFWVPRTRTIHLIDHPWTAFKARSKGWNTILHEMAHEIAERLGWRQFIRGAGNYNDLAEAIMKLPNRPAAWRQYGASNRSELRRAIVELFVEDPEVWVEFKKVHRELAEMIENSLEVRALKGIYGSLSSEPDLGFVGLRKAGDGSIWRVIEEGEIFAPGREYRLGIGEGGGRLVKLDADELADLRIMTDQDPTVMKNLLGDFGEEIIEFEGKKIARKALAELRDEVHKSIIRLQGEIMLDIDAAIGPYKTDYFRAWLRRSELGNYIDSGRAAEDGADAVLEATDELKAIKKALENTVDTPEIAALQNRLAAIEEAIDKYNLVEPPAPKVAQARTAARGTPTGSRATRSVKTAKPGVDEVGLGIDGEEELNVTVTQMTVGKNIVYTMSDEYYRLGELQREATGRLFDAKRTLQEAYTGVGTEGDASRAVDDSLAQFADQMRLLRDNAKKFFLNVFPGPLREEPGSLRNAAWQQFDALGRQVYDAVISITDEAIELATAGKLVEIPSLKELLFRAGVDLSFEKGALRSIRVIDEAAGTATTFQGWRGSAYIRKHLIQSFFGNNVHIRNAEEAFSLPFTVDTVRKSFTAMTPEEAIRATEEVVGAATAEAVEATIAETDQLWKAFIRQVNPSGGSLLSLWGSEVTKSRKAFIEFLEGEIQRLSEINVHPDTLAAIRRLQDEVRAFGVTIDSINLPAELVIQIARPLPRWMLSDGLQTWLGIQNDMVAQRHALVTTLNEFRAYMVDGLKSGKIDFANLAEEQRSIVRSVLDDAVWRKSAAHDVAMDGAKKVAEADPGRASDVAELSKVATGRDDYKGAVALTQFDMLEYANNYRVDSMIKFVSPFWMFQSRSPLFWINAFAQHPEYLAWWSRYARFQRKQQIESGATDSNGRPLRRLYGFLRLPGTDIWVNPFAGLSAKYVLPRPSPYAGEMPPGIGPFEEAAAYVYEYGNMFGFRPAPWIMAMLYMTGKLDSQRYPAGTLISQVDVVIPPWVQRDIRRALRMSRYPNDPGLFTEDVGWMDFLVEQEMYGRALAELQENPDGLARVQNEMYAALGYTTTGVDEFGAPIFDPNSQRDRSHPRWIAARDEIERSQYYSQLLGFFTGIYPKMYTDGEALLHTVRDDINFKRDMINSIAGVAVFQLDPVAESRYETYQAAKWETPEGWISQLYGASRWIELPGGGQASSGPERDEIMSQRIWEEETTQAYFDSLALASDELRECQINSGGIGSDSAVRRTCFRNYFRTRKAIDDHPAFDLARRPGIIGYKSEEQIVKYFENIWWNYVEATYPKWYVEDDEPYSNWQARVETWKEDLPVLASELAPMFLEKDVRTRTGFADQEGSAPNEIPGQRILLEEKLVQKLLAATTVEGYEEYKSRNDTPFDAMNEAFKALRWDPYMAETVKWEEMNSYERALAEEEWLRANNQTSLPELQRWVMENYPEGTFTPQELEQVFNEAGGAVTIEQRNLPNTERGVVENQVWDMLAAIGPGENFDVFEETFIRMGGDPDLLTAWYETGGTIQDFAKVQGLQQTLVDAAKVLNVQTPTQSQLTEWAAAKRLNDDFWVGITNTFGDDFRQVLAVYGSLSGQSKKNYRSDNPEIDEYYDMREAYGKSYQLWAKYYNPEMYTTQTGLAGEGVEKRGAASGGGGGGSGYSPRTPYAGGGGAAGDYQQYPPRIIGQGYRSTYDTNRLQDPRILGSGGVAGSPYWPAGFGKGTPKGVLNEIVDLNTKDKPLSEGAVQYVNSVKKPKWPEFIKELLELNARINKKGKISKKKPSGGGGGGAVRKV